MKQTLSYISGLLAIFGLVLAGAESTTDSAFAQLIISTIGIGLMILGLSSIVYLNRGE